MMNTKTQKRQFVVIGGVASGMSAASAVKRSDPSIAVVVLEKGEFVAYNACALPYYISNVMPDHRQLLDVTYEQAGQDAQIEVFTRHEAMSIVPAKQIVIVLDRETGEEKTFPYDGLMLATGGVPITPPVPGMNLPNIFQLRTLADGIEVKQYITDHTPQKATIIGGGYIGLEMAEACRMLGMDVTILEKFGSILGTMGNDVADVVEEHLRKHQVHLMKNVTVSSFEEGEGKCAYVGLDGQTQRLETDLVVIAIGVRPEIALARGAGIEIGSTGAIAVNTQAQTSINNIYAGGDCTEVTHLVSGEKIYVASGTVARKLGRTAGKNFVVPGIAAFKGVVGTMVAKVFELEIARTGLTLMEARRLGFDAIISTITADSRVRTYPGNQQIMVSLIFDRKSKRLLGAEMVGKEGVAQRINVLAAALHNQMTVHAISQLDLGYSPPFSAPWDPILIAANVGIKRLS